MKKVIALTNSFHSGLNVYKSKNACLRVLREVELIQPPWWTLRCSAFLRRVECTNTVACTNQYHVTHPIPVIVLEGLDGTGKSSVAHELAHRLHGIMLPTPDPEWSDVRQAFRSIPCAESNEDDDVSEVLGRAFYSAANYIAADEIMSLRSRTQFSDNENSSPSVVIMDRWWCSTCAMALAHHVMKRYNKLNNNNSNKNHHLEEEEIISLLPPMQSELYKWPIDLLPFKCGFLLQVDENVRIRRILQRAPADREETLLAQQACMRLAVTHVYRNMKLLQSINVNTSREAVNVILSMLPSLGVHHNATPFTTRELQEVQPC